MRCSASARGRVCSLRASLIAGASGAPLIRDHALQRNGAIPGAAHHFASLCSASCCAAPRGLWPLARDDSLLQPLVRVDAPQAFLLDPAVEALAGDAAPGPGAALDRAEHAGLQLGENQAVVVLLLVQGQQ